MNEKAIFLAFKNPNLETEARDLLACGRCTNKTYRLIWREANFPILQCCACEQNIGAIGWADEQQ